MTQLGAVIRVGIVVLWLGLLCWHTLGFFAPGLGRSLESAALVAPNLDRTMSYTVHRTNATQTVATCSMSTVRDEARFRSTIRAEILDPSALPGLGLLVKAIGDGSQTAMTLDLSQQLDERFRLMSFSASGAAFGMGLQANGYMDLSRLKGKYRIGAGAWTPFELPGLSNEPSAGTGLTVSLPPGMKPGDTFSTRITTFDAVSLSAKPATADYVVQASEMITIAKHNISTVRVAMSTAHRATAIMWCGDDGVAYRITIPDLGLTLDLSHISDITGQMLWPAKPSAKPSAAVPGL